MNVSELIERLKAHDPDLPVCLDDSEEGLCLVGDVAVRVATPSWRNGESKEERDARSRSVLWLTVGEYAARALYPEPGEGLA